MKGDEDVTEGSYADVTAGSQSLHRSLRGPEVQLFAIGGAIGTCKSRPGDDHTLSPVSMGDVDGQWLTVIAALYVQMGSALPKGGPAGLFIAFVIWGAVMWAVNECFAEMVTYASVPSPFIRFGSEWVDGALGFAMAWNFFLNMAILVPLEVVAMNIMITFWTDKIPVEAIIVAMILLYAFLNAVTVRFFGISEFYLSIGKVLLMLMLFLFTFITMVGGNPLHDRYGFRYWNKPGAFIEYNASGDTGRFLGVLSCVYQASFSYVYTQIDITNIAFADIWKHHWARVYLNGSSRDGEPSQDPASRFQVLCLADSGLLRRQCSVHWYRHPIGQSQASGYPRRRDIRQRYWCSIVSTTPGNMSDCFSHRVRPYVIAKQRLQIGGLPHLVNALIMTSIFSAGNALLYAATRTLHGMSLEGHAPRIFSYCTKRGVPLWALCFSLSFCLLAFLQVRSSSAVVMGYLVVLITCCQMLKLRIHGVCLPTLLPRSPKTRHLQRHFAPQRTIPAVH